MAFLFGAVPAVVDSRMTSVWHSRTDGRDRSGDWAMAHFIKLPGDQRVDIEGDFLSSHLPFSLGGVGGVFPNGEPWLLVLQQSALLPATGSAHAEELEVLEVSMSRALRGNPGAGADEGISWHGTDLLREYAARGADAEIVRKWSTTELLIGLLANCCGPTLADLATRYAAGCAFPGEPHVCQLVSRAVSSFTCCSGHEMISHVAVYWPGEHRRGGPRDAAELDPVVDGEGWVGAAGADRARGR